MNISMRTAVGYLAIAAILPYFTLKLAWIMGSTIGITGASRVDAEVVLAGNVVTAAMEMLAVAIILAFTHSWGARVPTWLVLPPTWVATGLLAPFVLTGPVVTAFVLSDSSSVGDGSLAPWVGPLVYGSFGAQALGIAASFVLYARDRWPRVLRGRIADHPMWRHRIVHLVFAWLITGALVTVVLARSAWALGATWGLSSQLVESRGVTDLLAEAGTALFAVAAAVGLLALIYRFPRRSPSWVPVGLVWIGSGAVFGSGVYPLVLLLTEVSGAGAVAVPPGIEPLVDLIQALVGTVIAVMGTFLLVGLDGSDEFEEPHPEHYVLSNT